MDEKTLRKLQLAELEILDEVVRVCESNNITYYLIAGTLLGAVRHKGFIPWDDDIDIAIPRSDYLRFTELCKTQLSKKYFLQTPDSEPLYHLAFSKVRKNGTLAYGTGIKDLNINKGIPIDIFVLDNLNNPNGLKTYIRGKLFNVMTRIISLKTAGRAIGHKNIIKKLVIYFPIKLKTLNKFRNKIMTCDKETSENYVNWASIYGYKKETFLKSKFSPPTTIEFEGKYYLAPNDYDFVLTKVYGRYMELPPIEQRTNHNPIEISFG